MTAVRVRAARKQATRQRLLAQARELFAAEGFEATTIRQVARAAGVAVGTVFVHFPDKNALLSAALEDQIASTLGRSLATLPAGDVRRRIRHVLGALLRSYARQPALSRVLVGHSLFAAGAERVRAREQIDDFIALLRGWCEESGVLRRGLSAQAAAEAIFAAYLVALIEGLGEKGPSPRRQLAAIDRLIEPWFAAVSTDETADRTASHTGGKR